MSSLESITQIIVGGIAFLHPASPVGAHSALGGPLSPVLALWLGALVVHLLDSLLPPQDEGVAEVTALTIGLGFLLYARARLGEVAYPGVMPFDLPFPTTGGRWLLALVLLGCAWAASLASLGHPTRGRAGRLAATGGALLFVLASDWSTMMLAWVVTDVALAYSLEGKDALKWTLPFSLGGSIALGTALVLWQQSAPILPPHAATLMTLAAILRLLPWPLPGWLSASADDERPATWVVTYVIPTATGSCLWAALTGYGIPGQYNGLATAALALGAITLVIGAVEAWGTHTPNQAVMSIATYGGAIITLEAGLGLSAACIAAAGACAVLSIVTVMLSWTFCHHLRPSETNSWWRAAPTALAILSLAGTPFTIGFVVRAGIYKGLFTGRMWFALLTVMAAESLMLATLLRLLLDLESDGETPEKNWQYELGYGAGAACAIALMGIGLSNRTAGLPGWSRLLSQPTLPVWAALALPLAGAVAIYRSPWMARVRSPHLRVEAIYQAIEAPLSRLRSLIWGATLVVEGQGYIAWVVLVCLVVLIFVLSH